MISNSEKNTDLSTIAAEDPHESDQPRHESENHDEKTAPRNSDYQPVDKLESLGNPADESREKERSWEMASR